MRRSPRKTLLFFSAILILTLLAGCSFGTGGTKKTDGDVSSVKDRENWDIAETSPLGKYPELVTYTLGQMKEPIIPISRKGRLMKIMLIPGI